MSTKPIGIKGIGVVSPLGVGIDPFTAALLDGANASISSSEGLPAGVRLQEDPAEMLETAKTYLDRASALTLAAASLARKEAGWDVDPSPPEKSGIALGTAFGCPDTMLRFWLSVVQKGPRLANTLFFSHSYPNIPASLEAIEHSLAGTHLTFCQGIASGALAVEAAMDAINLGSAKRMIAGGFDTIPALNSDNTSSNEPSLFFANSTPLPAEGAVMLALEPCSKDGSYFCRLVGSGSASFLPLPDEKEGGHWLLPDEECMAGAIAVSMERALASAGRNAADVGLVVLSACGNPALDRAEAAALKSVLHDNLDGVAMTALSGRTGCAPGAHALYGIIACGIALREEWIVEVGCPVGPELPDGVTLTLEPGEQPIQLALLNAIDPGGTCVTLVVTR